MAIFAVLALGEDPLPLAEKIKAEFPHDHYELGIDKWFISATGETAEQVAVKLGLNPDKKTLGIVIRVGTYHGWASNKIWEWLRVKIGEQPAKA